MCVCGGGCLCVCVCASRCPDGRSLFPRYKQDPWLWDLEWDTQELTQKKGTLSKERRAEIEAAPRTPLTDWEEGRTRTLTRNTAETPRGTTLPKHSAGGRST